MTFLKDEHKKIVGTQIYFIQNYSLYSPVNEIKIIAYILPLMKSKL